MRPGERISLGTTEWRFPLELTAASLRKMAAAAARLRDYLAVEILLMRAARLERQPVPVRIVAPRARTVRRF